MAYEVYSYKQGVASPSISPDQTVNVNQNTLDSNLTVSDAITLTAAYSVIKPVTNELFNIAVDAKGSSRLERNLAYAKQGAGAAFVGFGVAAKVGAAAGGLAAAGALLIPAVVTEIKQIYQYTKDLNDQEANIKKLGVLKKQYISGGNYYD